MKPILLLCLMFYLERLLGLTAFPFIFLAGVLVFLAHHIDESAKSISQKRVEAAALFAFHGGYMSRVVLRISSRFPALTRKQILEVVMAFLFAVYDEEVK